MSSEILKEKSKCPFTGAGTPPKHPTGKGTSNRDSVSYTHLRAHET